MRAMDEFRGMKLVRKFVDKTQAININVNFDKQKHLSDSHVQRRERMRKRCIAKAQAEDEELEREKKRQKELQELERFDLKVVRMVEQTMNRNIKTYSEKIRIVEREREKYVAIYIINDINAICISPIFKYLLTVSIEKQL